MLRTFASATLLALLCAPCRQDMTRMQAKDTGGDYPDRTIAHGEARSRPAGRPTSPRGCWRSG